VSLLHTDRQTHYPVATITKLTALINPNACHMRTGVVEGSRVSVTHRQTDTLSSCNHYKAKLISAIIMWPVAAHPAV